MDRGETCREAASRKGTRDRKGVGWQLALRKRVRDGERQKGRDSSDVFDDVGRTRGFNELVRVTLLSRRSTVASPISTNHGVQCRGWLFFQPIHFARLYV